MLKGIAYLRAEHCPDIDYPPALNTPEFRAQFEAYLAWRRKMKFTKWKPVTIRRQLDKMVSWGASVAIAGIKEAMDQQWQSVWPPKGKPASAATASEQHLNGF